MCVTVRGNVRVAECLPVSILSNASLYIYFSSVLPPILSQVHTITAMVEEVVWST